MIIESDKAEDLVNANPNCQDWIWTLHSTGHEPPEMERKRNAIDVLP